MPGRATATATCWRSSSARSTSSTRVADEEESLLAERGRLRQIDGLRAAAGAGAEAITPESGDGGGAALALGEAERLADAVAGADPELDALAERLRALRIEAEDLGAELRRYAGGLEAEPGRLEEVESRLEQYDRLRRKHGGSVESVLAHAEHCRAELERLERSDDDEARLTAELDCGGRRGARAGRDRSSATRTAAAPKLAERVLEELPSWQWREPSSRSSCIPARSSGRPEPSAWSS